ncbi:MAG: hypothetical protein M8364_15960 [Methylobacter sp.]|uniref:hypothetical protein n=1 Tax=Methylobacter sp. TaxID=2051955 RepID=UPI00258429B9|nr:hypothetical protein [Methylobacter sp.]MCL7422387.1 hypothetical protein [Methylobacter sp.]
MLDSKVIRKYYGHVTRADYHDTKPVLGSENIVFPRTNSLQGRALRTLLEGSKISHRDFDSISRSYRLAGYVGSLRDKGWPIVNHDYVALTKDIVPRKAEFTRYELFAEFTPELQKRIAAFCKAVNEFESNAASKAVA